LNFDFNATQVLRSGPLTIPSGESFVTGVNSVSGNFDLHWSTIIIEVNQP
ncbi:MAG: hypothetical protein HRT45_08930, partial [Bdellovibrionales bacterium]|nr:hypothetical protein [Bdellovibrionales bacterium]